MAAVSDSAIQAPYLRFHFLVWVLFGWADPFTVLVSSVGVAPGSRDQWVVRDLPVVNSSSSPLVHARLPRDPPDVSGSPVRPPESSPTGELSLEAIPVNLTKLSTFF